MKNFLTLCFILLGLGLAAQPGGGAQNGKPQQPGSNNGHIFGKITDSTGKALADISVVVLQQKPGATGKTSAVLVKGTTTQGNGEFDFEDLPGNVKLTVKISGVGFTPQEIAVSFAQPQHAAGQGQAGGGSEKDLGAIKLKASAGNELQSVTVLATKSLMKLDIDKKVFNVEKNIVSEGGTAVDVMKNVPSLQVDIDGNVALRNATPQILVDGLPTTLTLDQIPANAIESVEVITNPSAKYDASGGGAGILNIVLKKNKKMGYNGNVRTGINKYGAVDGGVDFSLRQNKFNVTAGVNVRQNNNKEIGTITRTNLSDNPVTVLNQVNTSKNAGTMIFGRLGLDYFISNKTTLSLTGMKMHGDMSPVSTQELTTDSMYNGGLTKSYSERITNNSRIFNGQGITFGFKHIYHEGEDLTANVNYFTGKSDNTTLYTTNAYTNGKGSEIDNSQAQQILGGGTDKNLVMQVDYEKQISKTAKIEAGARAAMRSRININNNYTFDNATGEYVLQPSAASNYTSNDNVYAAYATYTSSIKDFGYKIGLRAESSNYNGELTDTRQKFSNTYPVSLFPSVFLSQKLGGNQEVQLSYTRRINRPNFFQLIPFIDSSDNLNIRKGNPALAPEFTQSFEANYLKTFGGSNTFLASIYYRKTTNLITSYLQQQQDVNGNNILVNTYINANSAYSAGGEFTLQNNWTKWWSTSTDVNIYNSKVTASDTSTQAALWSWFAKLNSNFKLPSNFSIQLSGMYQSKTNLISSSTQNQGGGGPGGGGPGGGGGAQSSSQGYIKAFYGVDVAVKKTFMNNKFSVSLSVNDIFRSRKQDTYSYSSYFTQDYSRLRDPQMFRLNLAYSFGKIDANLFKRKSQSTETLSSDGQ